MTVKLYKIEIKKQTNNKLIEEVNFSLSLFKIIPKKSHVSNGNRKACNYLQSLAEQETIDGCLIITWISCYFPNPLTLVQLWCVVLWKKGQFQLGM